MIYYKILLGDKYGYDVIKRSENKGYNSLKSYFESEIKKYKNN